MLTYENDYERISSEQSVPYWRKYRNNSVKWQADLKS